MPLAASVSSETVESVDEDENEVIMMDPKNAYTFINCIFDDD
jgi:hypothetical protein